MQYGGVSWGIKILRSELKRCISSGMEPGPHMVDRRASLFALLTKKNWQMGRPSRTEGNQRTSARRKSQRESAGFLQRSGEISVFKEHLLKKTRRAQGLIRLIEKKRHQRERLPCVGDRGAGGLTSRWASFSDGRWILEWRWRISAPSNLDG